MKNIAVDYESKALELGLSLERYEALRKAFWSEDSYLYQTVVFYRATNLFDVKGLTETDGGFAFNDFLAYGAKVLTDYDFEIALELQD